MQPAVPPWIAALQKPSCYDHPVAEVELVETHASWVFLAGAFAYKVKKPVDFGFLDFSTLARRQHFCREELRLNRRTAPQLYLEVVVIGGTPEHPVLGGEPVLDYAVKMLRFPQECQLDRLLAAGRLEGAQIEQFAEHLADIHGRLPIVEAGSAFGSPAAILAPVQQNFEQLRSLVAGARAQNILAAVETWSLERFAALEATFRRRRSDGFVRECHGDVHLANIAWLDGAPVLFDCIEFNENFRWIDLVNDYAFLVMDLDDRRQGALGWQFLNRYLRSTGDFTGLALLRFYQVYRALVRAKVAFLRLDQERSAAARGCDLEQAESYLDLAAGYTVSRPVQLLITHGLSGSGKSTFVHQLAPLLGAIALHSDIERKRLYGLAAEESSHSPVDGGIYRAAGHRATYQRLGELAGTALAAGFPVIVDATFIRRTQRDQLRRLAGRLGVPLVILDFQVPEAELRRRVERRSSQRGTVSEATMAVLDTQLDLAEPLSATEREGRFVVHPETRAEEVAGWLQKRPRF